MSKKNIETTELQTIESIELTKIQEIELNEATDRILTIQNSIVKNKYAIAVILAEIDDKKLYQAGGFKNTVEYAQKNFDYKKSEAYTLIRVGRNFTAETLESNLPHDKVDYTLAQIEKLLPVGDKDEIEEFIKSSDITPDMTVKEISAVVKEKLGKNKAVSGQSEKEKINVYSQDENTVEELQLAYDEARNACLKFASLLTSGDAKYMFTKGMKILFKETEKGTYNFHKLEDIIDYTSFGNFSTDLNDTPLE